MMARGDGGKPVFEDDPPCVGSTLEIRRMSDESAGERLVFIWSLSRRAVQGMNRGHRWC